MGIMYPIIAVLFITVAVGFISASDDTGNIDDKGFYIFWIVAASIIWPVAIPMILSWFIAPVIKKKLEEETKGSK